MNRVEASNHGVDCPSALVMMATYNGERFIRPQIESILSQSGVSVSLLIYDDCSSDSTYSICQEYAEQYDNVSVFQNSENQGVAKNFMGMVYDSNADGYDLYAFSDQDDIWDHDKLRTAADQLLSEENVNSPTLYYSDIQNEWIDENGTCTHVELEISRFKECENAPLTPLITNWVNGCAMVFNASLRNLLLVHRLTEFPRYHDSWVHVVARYCGTIVADYDSVLVHRRISGLNVVGEKPINPVQSPRDYLQLLKLALFNREHIMLRCAEELLDGYAAYIHPEYLGSIEDFVSYRTSLLSRARVLLSNDYWLPTFQARARIKLAFLIGFY